MSRVYNDSYENSDGWSVTDSFSFDDDDDSFAYSNFMSSYAGSAQTVINGVVERSEVASAGDACVLVVVDSDRSGWLKPGTRLLASISRDQLVVEGFPVPLLRGR